MNGQLMFATLAMHFNLKEKYKSINDEVKKEILEWMDQDPGVIKSNMGGWHSRPTHTGKLKKFTNIWRNK